MYPKTNSSVNWHCWLADRNGIKVAERSAIAIQEVHLGQCDVAKLV